MENSYHAIIMAGAILIFMVAVSIGILTYTRIIEANNAILTESEFFDMNSENFKLNGESEDTDRVYSGAEVVMQIINLYEGKDYTYNSITVKGRTYNASKTESEDGLNSMDIKSMNGIVGYLGDLVNKNFVVSDISFNDGIKVSYVEYSE